MKYNLTFWQRVELIPLWVMWFFHADKKARKSWHAVKKGMEKHEHNFRIPVWYSKEKYLMCDHEGCTETEPPPLKLKAG